LAQVASFLLQAHIPADNLRRALNRTLPGAIRVLDANIVPPSFHARHSTLAKTYEYRVFPERHFFMDLKDKDCPDPVLSSSKGLDSETPGIILCPPFLARYVYPYPWPLDVAALECAAAFLTGTHDFLSFAATDPDQAAREGSRPTLTGEDGDTTLGAVRTIHSSTWRQQQIEDGILLVYRVRGNGFLHHMVRNLVGTMLDIGRGYRPADEIPAMIAARSRATAGPTAPACGLFLHSVEYTE
jgi:tRNA pseudouridine38-40 synthase